MGALLGAIGWIITLAPLIFRFATFVVSKVLPKVARKGATSGSITISATVIGYFVTTGLIAVMALSVVAFHEEMFALVRDYILPVLGFVLRPASNLVASFLPTSSSPHFALLMGVVNAFDFATPISVLVICWAFSFTIGLYMRTFKI
ncbi:MAG: hypothetical protein LBU89_09400 [Fibromonadaceae bacterium]|jgi:hypothetical protein|nr:hypothetical protein [Fibromonadaceae bacterium]